MPIFHTRAHGTLETYRYCIYRYIIYDVRFPVGPWAPTVVMGWYLMALCVLDQPLYHLLPQIGLLHTYSQQLHTVLMMFCGPKCPISVTLFHHETLCTYVSKIQLLRLFLKVKLSVCKPFCCLCWLSFLSLSHTSPTLMSLEFRAKTSLPLCL